MKNKLFYISIVGLLSLSACSKLLEEKSQSEVIPQTTVDFRELLMGSGYMGRSEPSSFLYYMDDDVDFSIEYGNNNNDLLVGTDGAKQPLPLYSWQPYYGDRDGLGLLINTDPASTAYAAYYERIKGCNAVLDNIDAAIGTQLEKDRVKGEALAIRAFFYFQLVNLYGAPYNANPDALGVPLKLESGVSQEFMKRATVKEVYTQVVNDLKEASRLMDPLPIARRDYHINQPAIHIILSRVYLYMENWTGVVEEVNAAFAQGCMLYDLGAVTVAPYLTYTNPEVEWMFAGSPQAEQSTYAPSPALYSLYDANDKRLTLGLSVQTQTGTALVVKMNLGGSDLVQTIRTGEAVLNRAEAYAQLNKLPEAVDDLNDLRRTRIPGYTDVSIADKTVALTTIREERRKEFCYEGHRWFDLRRYGMPSISHRYKIDKGQPIVHFVLAEKDPMYTLPFPNSLVLRNPSLIQNPSAAISERQSQ